MANGQKKPKRSPGAPPSRPPTPQPQPAAPPPQPQSGTSWFDMFAQAPTLGAAPGTPQIPQVGGGAAAPQPAVDPFTAFLMSRANQPQQPLIPQFDLAGAIQAMRSQGPVAEFNALSSLPSYAPQSQNPFATGYFNQPSSMGVSPEGVLATQGNTATNQLAQMGAVPNIDPELLRRLNMGVAQRRAY